MSDEWYQEWQTEEKAYEDKWQYAVEEHIKTVNAASHPEARTTFPDQRTRPEDGDPQNPQAGESVMIAPTAREDMRTASIGRNVIKIAPAIDEAVKLAPESSHAESPPASGQSSPSDGRESLETSLEGDHLPRSPSAKSQPSPLFGDYLLGLLRNGGLLPKPPHDARVKLEPLHDA